MKEIQSNAHQNFIVCKESMTYLNQILSECGLTCGLLRLLTTKDKCLKKVNKQGICGRAPDLTSHFYCCFLKKKNVQNGICSFMKISQHQKHSGTRHTWEVKPTLYQQRAVTHRCGWWNFSEPLYGHILLSKVISKGNPDNVELSENINFSLCMWSEQVWIISVLLREICHHASWTYTLLSSRQEKSNRSDVDFQNNPLML